MRKFDIARLLAERCGYTSYLEICTSATGFTYAQVDKRQFPRHVRLMSRCPPGFSDGAPLDLATDNDSSEDLFAKLLSSGERFDLVFIDPWHTYAASLRDLVYGLQLVTSHGTVLVHDCSPPHADCAVPEFIPGEWCGVTFAAFLDVVLFAGDLPYATIDSDYGCGLISHHPVLKSFLHENRPSDLVARWRLLALPQKYALLDQHRDKLLRLISPDELRAALDASHLRLEWGFGDTCNARAA